jgi:hypothetical protein
MGASSRSEDDLGRGAGDAPSVGGVAPGHGVLRRDRPRPGLALISSLHLPSSPPSFPRRRMHRISVFRDDIIFVIYMVQRRLYAVDATRPAEGYEDDDEDRARAGEVGAGGAAAEGGKAKTE